MAAEALFDEARAAAAQGDYARACEKLSESQRLDPAPGTLLNLADCKERLGLVATAWQLYREAADLFARANADDRAAFARKRAAALEPRLAQLSIVLAPGVAPARVTRDGVDLAGASLGSALPLDPGAHVVVVTSSGRRDARYEVRLAEGETRTLRVEPGPPGEAPVEPAAVAPVAPPSGVGAPRAAGLALLGLSAGAIAAGVVTGVMTLDRKATVDASCRDKLCGVAGVDAAAEGRTLSAVSTVSFLGGAVGLALGAYLTVTGPRWAGAPSVRVRPAAGPGAASLGLDGAF